MKHEAVMLVGSAAPNLLQPPNDLRVEVNPVETHGLLAKKFVEGDALPCFLGLSPDTSFSNRRRLRAILQWLKPKTSRLTIAEGSFLTRWNLRALEGYSEDAAEHIARDHHYKTSKRIAATVSGEFETMRITILDWPSVVGDAVFQDIRVQIENYAARNPAFARGVISVVDDFLSRMKKRGAVVAPNDNRMLLLKSYVFEELAMFVHLYQAGFAVEVYPGDELQLMRQFGAGNFDDFPFDLSERTHVSIRLSQ